jgi:hypothetical protein
MCVLTPLLNLEINADIKIRLQTKIKEGKTTQADLLLAVNNSWCTTVYKVRNYFLSKTVVLV